MKKLKSLIIMLSVSALTSLIFAATPLAQAKNFESVILKLDCSGFNVSGTGASEMSAGTAPNNWVAATGNQWTSSNCFAANITSVPHIAKSVQFGSSSGGAGSATTPSLDLSAATGKTTKVRIVLTAGTNKTGSLAVKLNGNTIGTINAASSAPGNTAFAAFYYSFEYDITATGTSSSSLSFEHSSTESSGNIYVKEIAVYKEPVSLLKLDCSLFSTNSSTILSSATYPNNWTASLGANPASTAFCYANNAINTSYGAGVRMGAGTAANSGSFTTLNYDLSASQLYKNKVYIEILVTTTSSGKLDLKVDNGSSIWTYNPTTDNGSGGAVATNTWIPYEAEITGGTANSNISLYQTRIAETGSIYIRNLRIHKEYPGAPSNVSSVAGNGKASVSFTTPEVSGGSPIISYSVTSIPDGIIASGATSPIVITGLTNETSYTFKVKAVNSGGEGTESSASNVVIPHSINNIIAVNSSTNLSSLTISPVSDYNVEGGSELTVNTQAIVNSIALAPGAKITINNSTNLTATSGITLQSDATGTATLKNNGTYSGNITAQQYLGTARNWYVSSPVVNSATPGFTTTPDFAGIDYYYEYMEAGDNDPSGQPGSPTAYWKGLNNGSTMAVGKGYIAKANAGTTISFSGTPNNGNITTGFDLTRNDTKGKGFNLAGNPYPSYIDWTDVAAANPNLDNTFYYRTKNIDETYAFVTWNGSGNTYVNSKGDIANTTITRFIPPTQAFWVRVKTGTAATKMFFNNDMREHRDVNGNLMKAPRQDTRPSVRLQLINGTQRDELLIYQDAGASNDYDSYDSPKMMNNSTTVPDLYSIAGDEQLVINGLNAITENMELPLGFSLKSAAALTIKATELNNLPEGRNVYLLDKTANTQTLLTTETDYSFTTTEATINNESRFSLVFKSPGITTVNNASEFNKMAVFVNAQNELVIIAPENSTYAIYTMVGEQVKTGRVTDNAVRVNTVSKGVYLVKVNNRTMKVAIR